MQADTPGYVEVDVLAHAYVFQFWIPGDCSEFDSKIIASHLFSVYVFFFAIHNHKKQCNWNSCYHNQSPCKTGPPSQVHHELISRDSHQNEALTRHVHGNFHCHLQIETCVQSTRWLVSEIWWCTDFNGIELNVHTTYFQSKVPSCLDSQHLCACTNSLYKIWKIHDKVQRSNNETNQCHQKSNIIYVVLCIVDAL